MKVSIPVLIFAFVLILAGTIGYFAWKIKQIKKRLIKRMKSNVTNMFVKISEEPELISIAKDEQESEEGKKAKEKIDVILKTAFDAGIDEESCEESVDSYCEEAWMLAADGGPYIDALRCNRDHLHRYCNIIR